MQFSCARNLRQITGANISGRTAGFSRLNAWLVALLAAAFSLPGGATEPQPSTSAYVASAPRVALVIGNAVYRGADRLGSPLSDAGLIAESLRSVGFTVDLEENQTRGQMLDALDRFGKVASKAAIALVYYAGHGFENGGENYLIPVDLPVPIGKVTHADLQRYAIPLRYVRSSASSGAPRAVIVLLDACRSPAVRGAGRQVMTKVDAGHGELIAFATQPGGVALDSFWLGATRYDHSPFAYYLSQQMRTGDDMLTMLRHTQIMVSGATADTQRPWFNDGLVGDLKLSDSAAPGPRMSVRQPAALLSVSRGTAVELAAAPDASDAAPAAAGAARWDAEVSRMLALLPDIWQNPDVANRIHDQAEQGDLFSMTAMAMALQNRPPMLTDQIWYRMRAQATAYAVYAAGRRYPLAEALYGNWRLNEAHEPADLYTAALFLQHAVDDGFVKATEKLIPLLPKVGRAASVDQYRARYRDAYGRDPVLTTVD